MNLNRKPTGGYIGVDIGSTSIKKVMISKKGDGYQIDGYSIQKLPRGIIENGEVQKVDDLIEVLAKVLAGSKNASGLTFALPFASVATGYERVDIALSSKEMEQHILSQLSKFIALPVAEVSFDYATREVIDGSGRYKDLLIVAAKTVDVASKAEVYEVAGVKPTVATVDAFAIERLVPHVGVKGDQPIAFFDIGDSKSTLYVVQKGEVVFSRDNKFAFQDLIDIIKDEYRVDGEEARMILEQNIDKDEFIDRALSPYYERFATTLNQMLELCFSSTSARSVSTVYMMGGGSSLPGIKEAAASILGYTGYGIESVDPFGKISVGSSVDKKAFEKDMPALIMALGLSLCDVGSCINLLPWREEIAQEKKKNYLVGAAMAAAIGVAISYGGLQLVKQINTKQEEATALVTSTIESVDSQLSELAKVTELRQAMFDRMALIQGLQTQRPVSVAMLMSIVDSVPNQAFLSSVSKTGTSFSIQGYASNPEVVSDLLRNLKESGYFDNVSMSSFDTTGTDTVELKDGSGRYGKFNVSAEVSQSALDGKIQEPKTKVEVVSNSEGLTPVPQLEGESGNSQSPQLEADPKSFSSPALVEPEVKKEGGV